VPVSAANLHDSQVLIPPVTGIPAIRSQRGPRRRRPVKLRADKGYDFDQLRAFLRERGIVPRIASRGIDQARNSAGIAGRSNGPSPGSAATAA
jgi:hypothetical protein